MSAEPQEPAVTEEPLPEAEEVDALPVLAGDAAAQERAAQVPAPWTAPPAAQIAAVAAGGFVAGAAVVGLTRRRRRRASATRSRGRGRETRGIGELVQIVGTRSLLVDVHLLGGRG